MRSWNWACWSTSARRSASAAGVVVGAAGVDLGVERVDLCLQLGDLGLQFGAGGDHAVDGLLALHVDVRLDVGVGQRRRRLRVAALHAGGDDVGVAEAAAGDARRVLLQAEVLDQPGVHDVALEHRDLVLHQAVGVDGLLPAPEHRFTGQRCGSACRHRPRRPTACCSESATAGAVVAMIAAITIHDRRMMTRQ